MAIAVIFIDPLSDAISSVDLGAAGYASEVTLILDQLPVLVALFAIMVAGSYISKKM